ncbi:MAG: DJ-1/PfpI family protein [Planctomycetes bacterium]|nr:DJ-1/PfpI family protein [Planctomycetota bacterium]
MGRAAALVGLLLVAGCASPRPPEIPAGGMPAPPIAVGILLLDGVHGSALAAPIDVFQHTVAHVEPHMRVFTVGRSFIPVTTHEGLALRPKHDLEDAPAIDVLVVPGGERGAAADLEDLALVQWVARRGRDAKHVLALGNGAFLLAEAGLLRERQCTTHPGDMARFLEEYPHIPAVPDVSFVADHETITGAGGARSYEPALYLVETLLGKPVAEAVARDLLIDWDLEKVPHRLVAPPAPAPAARN